MALVATLHPKIQAQLEVAPDQEYLLLATQRTGTMQEELDEASANGFRFLTPTALCYKRRFGGDELVVVLEQTPKTKQAYEYLLLATSLTSTLQSEVSETVASGFKITGYVSCIEHIIIMERTIS